MVMKPNGKSPVSSSNDQEVMFFKDILPDAVGNMKLVNGQSHIECRILDEVEIATTPRGPVMKLYFWEKTATDFCKKFTAYKNTPTLLLVTTVNTKHLGDVYAPVCDVNLGEFCSLSI